MPLHVESTLSIPTHAISRKRQDHSFEESSPFMMVDDTGRDCIAKEELAFSIVWSPLPPITWIFPFIGHTGICNSAGVASDFRGPYFVGDDGRMAFGAPTRALRINVQEPNVSAEQWNEAIKNANGVYSTRMHNIFCDNCHSHVALALNQMKISAFGIQKWDMVKLAFLMFFRARFLSWGAVLQQFFPLLIMVALILWLKL